MNATIDVTGGDVVARFLKAVGVSEVYGIPGGHTLGLNEGIALGGIRFITFRHEYSAGCAAAAFGRVGPHAGVAVVTCGPGVTNAATAMAGALRDGNPMLLLSVNNRAEHVGWGDAQDADAVAVLSSVSKWCTYVDRQEAIEPALRRAWRLAHSDRPGPVLVDFARDVIESAASVGAISVPESSRASARPGDRDIETVREVLERAERPVLWVGRGALDALHSGALATLADRLQIPIISTFNAMEAGGALGELSLGVLSRVGTQLTRDVMAESDLVLCLGNSLNGVSTKRWSLKLPRTIQVDIRPDRFSDMYPGVLGVAADVSAFCQDLSARVGTSACERWSTWRSTCMKLKREWNERVRGAMATASTSPVAPLALMGLFQKFAMDSGQIWSIDASNAGIWAHALSFRDGARVLRPVNFSNMGYALGSAIGASRANVTTQPINVLVGDGSLGMSLGDLETIYRLKTPVRIFVLNDCSLSNIRQEVDFKYRRKEESFDFTDTRYDKIAAGFGIPALRINHLDQLETELRGDSDVSGPRLFDIRTDGGPSVWTDTV